MWKNDLNTFPLCYFHTHTLHGRYLEMKLKHTPACLFLTLHPNWQDPEKVPVSWVKPVMVGETKSITLLLEWMNLYTGKSYIKRQICFSTDLTVEHIWFTLHRYNKGTLNGSNCILTKQSNLMVLGHTIYIIYIFLTRFMKHTQTFACNKMFWCLWQIYWVKA